MLLQFINTNYVRADGRYTSFHAFVEAFHDFVFERGSNPAKYSPKCIRGELEAAGLIVGQGPHGIAIGNLFDPKESRRRWIKINSRDLRLAAIAS